MFMIRKKVVREKLPTSKDPYVVFSVSYTLPSLEVNPATPVRSRGCCWTLPTTSRTMGAAVRNCRGNCNWMTTGASPSHGRAKKDPYC